MTQVFVEVKSLDHSELVWGIEGLFVRVHELHLDVHFQVRTKAQQNEFSVLKDFASWDLFFRFLRFFLLIVCFFIDGVQDGTLQGILLGHDFALNRADLAHLDWFEVLEDGLLVHQQLERLFSFILPVELPRIVSGVSLENGIAAEVEHIGFDLFLPNPLFVFVLHKLAGGCRPTLKQASVVDSGELTIIGVCVPNDVVWLGPHAKEVYHIPVSQRNNLDELVIGEEGNTFVVEIVVDMVVDSRNCFTNLVALDLAVPKQLGVVVDVQATGVDVVRRGALSFVVKSKVFILDCVQPVFVHLRHVPDFASSDLLCHIVIVIEHLNGAVGDDETIEFVFFVFIHLLTFLIRNI